MYALIFKLFKQNIKDILLDIYQSPGETLNKKMTVKSETTIIHIKIGYINYANLSKRLKLSTQSVPTSSTQSDVICLNNNDMR